MMYYMVLVPAGFTITYVISRRRLPRAASSALLATRANVSFTILLLQIAWRLLTAMISAYLLASWLWVLAWPAFFAAEASTVLLASIPLFSLVGWAIGWLQYPYFAGLLDGYRLQPQESATGRIRFMALAVVTFLARVVCAATPRPSPHRVSRKVQLITVVWIVFAPIIVFLYLLIIIILYVLPVVGGIVVDDDLRSSDLSSIPFTVASLTAILVFSDILASLRTKTTSGLFAISWIWVVWISAETIEWVTESSDALASTVGVEAPGIASGVLFGLLTVLYVDLGHALAAVFVWFVDTFKGSVSNPAGHPRFQLGADAVARRGPIPASPASRWGGRAR